MGEHVAAGYGYLPVEFLGLVLVLHPVLIVWAMVFGPTNRKAADVRS